MNPNTTEKRRGRWAGGASIVAILAVAASAQTLQRQTLSGGGEVSAGSGYRLEGGVGQVASAKSAGLAEQVYSGYLNTNHAPGTVVDLAGVTGAAEGTIQLTWTAPGADGLVGQAAEIRVKVATSPITTLALFEAASTYAVLVPLASGGFETRQLANLAPDIDYFFAVAARDAAGNQGALSNVTSTDTFAVPPAAVIDLTAAPAGSGAAQLTWTAPGDDGAVGALAPGQYRIDHSTDPAHVFSFGTYQTLVATMAVPGAAQSLVVGGLLGNATVSFGLFTGDDVPVFSGASNHPVLLTEAYQPVGSAYAGVSSTAFSAVWQTSGNSAPTEYRVEVSSFPSYSPVIADSGWVASTVSSFSGLEAFTTYYARVKARNAAGIETGFTDLGPLQLTTGLSAPLGILASAMDRAVALHWNPVLSGAPVSTRIYRATAPGGPFALAGSAAMPSGDFTDTGLTNGVTYYYRLAAAGITGESLPSGVIQIVPRDGILPQGLAGLLGGFSGTDFVIQWDANPYNADGSALADLKGYRVYRSSTVGGTPALLAVLPPIGSPTFTDPMGQAVAPAWYFVRAVDTSDNESIDSPWVLSSTVREYRWVSPDQRAAVTIPLQVVATLSQQGIILLWKRHPEDENGRIAASYELTAIASAGAQPMGSDFLLPSGRSRITFRYTPLPTAGSALAANAVFYPKDMAVFFHNGVEFVKLGGEVDTSEHTITVVSRHVGRYIVKQSLRATAFTVLQTAPRRVFTPNGDGVNDTFQILFENPNDSIVSQAKVFDLTGAEVSDLQLGSTGDSLGWNGKDRSGRAVSGGIYIYQLQAEGRTWNGTVVVAR